MSHVVTIQKASEQLAQLVRGLGPGDEIVLTENDKPVARIVPGAPSKPIEPRKPGAWMGKLTIVKDDEEHLEDFKEYMP